MANGMCGDHLKTLQSGAEGFPCNKVYIVETVSILKEVYVAFTHDRKN
jgi:succinyl-CoA synthetase beta subunit